MQGNGAAGNGHPSAPVSSPGGTGAPPAPPAPAKTEKAKDKKASGRPYKPGESGNITGAGAGRKPGLPARNSRLGMLLEKKIRPTVAKLIKARYGIDVAGLTYEEGLMDLAIAYETKGKPWLLERLLGYSYLTLDAEVCQLKDQAPAQGGGGPGNNLNFTLNAFEQALRATEPHAPGSDRIAFGEDS